MRPRLPSPFFLLRFLLALLSLSLATLPGVSAASTPVTPAPLPVPHANPFNAVPTTPPASPAPAVPWLTLGTEPQQAFMRIPEGCQTSPCPLVVVSHPRAQTAGRLRASHTVTTLLDELTRANFVVLLSHDGGPTTWGSPSALDSVAVTHAQATRLFVWNRRTYALGLSMGGLLALRSALPSSPYRVDGVALIDAWADLRGAWGTAQSRRQEINAAYGLTSAPTPDLDPLPLTLSAPQRPLFIAASPQDRTVPAATNSEKLATHALPGMSEYVQTSGPHMGGNRFTPEMGQRIATFYLRLEQEYARR